ncbi:MAG: hypothetical protein HQ568_05645 [Calditrichaeota bacterium]|nr:hypothetical protein [Calditrichota bacterium]
MRKELKIFDNPRNVKILVWGLYIALAVLLVIDFFIHKHGYFAWEDKVCFFAAFGFVSYVILIIVAVVLRFFVKRDENYYER